TSLRSLSLFSNQLTGSIPVELGNLTNLYYLYLDRNQLTGSIPVELENLTSLGNNSSDLRWNALHSADAALVAFLDSKQSGGDWQSTQTIAPTGVGAGSATATSVTLGWTPITYTADTGGYRVLYSQTAGGPYTPFATMTADKAAASLTVTGLQPATPYYFVVETQTNPNDSNANTVLSEPSAEVQGATAVAQTLTVSKQGTGTGTVTSSPAGIDCGTVCELSFTEGTVVDLGQAASLGSTFLGWSDGCGGSGACSVTMDGPKLVTATFDLIPAPTITSADHATFIIGQPGTFAVTATGVPTPSLALTGTLPSGITFTDNGGGSATLGGTAAAGTRGVYPLTITAHNGVDPDAVQAFTLTVVSFLPTSERQALIDLYNATTGGGWYTRTSWRNTGDTDFNAPGTECTWFGVTCDAGGEHVTGLSLASNNLVGTIPASLATLSSLQYLNLRNNHLTGSIPVELGNLTNLNYLYLYDNQLTGSIPVELGDLTNLYELLLRNNQLTGSIPVELGNLTNLYCLYLDSNQLTGSIPSELGGLANLTGLFLYHNQLTGSVPVELGNLTNLNYLYLFNNQLTGSIPVELGNLGNLLVLDLSLNQLTGSIPVELGNLAGLHDLRLFSNQLTGSIPVELGNLTNLSTLVLSGNQLTGSIPVELGNLTYLRYLYLDNNQLAGSIPVELGNLTNLWYLNLSSNQLTGSIPVELENLTSLSNNSTDLRWNALHSADAALIAFLNSKQFGGNWQSTQTIAPTGVGAGSPTPASLDLSWTPITYSADTGGYQVLYSQISGGPYRPFMTLTPSKASDALTVTGLAPETKYYFVVRTQTDPHAHNANAVVSEYSDETSGTTAEAPYQNGDVNGDGSDNVQDVFFLINYLFAGGPGPVGPGDVNGDGSVNVQDVFYLINYLFAGGPGPV
ncbi:MAG TPA: leucine-rich repeat domain-containing protein, partial [Thermoanaerobaculaceae bacterium]|nr:leucine-rich repeat domain-containing protein [Thermoanaerobaculaceae bacterium]